MKENEHYTKFVSLIKENKYPEAYGYLYPYVLKNDKKSMKLISKSYTYGKAYGVDIDLIKANIWQQRSELESFSELGKVEYNQFLFFLSINKPKMASFFLQKSAELGYKEAIYKIKDEKYVKLNEIIIDEYWKDFDYSDLYPYCHNIKEDCEL
ncbi:hypothetical protein [Acinetobacter shaoyimingii]|uniref:Uncharacterized protein n=1 Tax=Acinetobacter shaoyimingii TaxID=2715164 RepID=A0A6G8RVY4_9GAMM|nr:hypothetical protein [Acinetobacter shaoyimingii]QIO05883.1 hypothetical protein G8E00_07920 [Acinetobacter shaoyimingii]